MRKYAILTYDMNAVGGTQLYSANKAKCLAEQGWEVYLFSCAILKQTRAFQSANSYYIPFAGEPPYILGERISDRIVDRMAEIIGQSEGDEIIIESHADIFPQWGELLAEKLGAKHVLIPLSEEFRTGRRYAQKLDFFSFKFDRGELGGDRDYLQRLFGDYRELRVEECHEFWMDEDPLSDVYDDGIEQIEHSDYNICHIGRIVKGYVPDMLDGIRKFAVNHCHESIQVIFVGNIDGRREEISKAFAGLDNLKILELGDKVPIPRMLLDKVDVVLGISGSVRCVAYERKPAVVVATNGLSNGLLGYETKESIYPDKRQWPVDLALERALVERVWKELPFDYPQVGVERCCKQNFEFIQHSNQEKIYYDKKKLLAVPTGVSRSRRIKGKMKYWLFHKTPAIARVLIRMKYNARKQVS